MKKIASFVFALVFMLITMDCALADGPFDWLSDAWEGTTNWVEGAWDNSTEWIEGAWGDTTEWVEGAWEDSSEWVTGAVSDAWSWTSGAVNDAGGWIAGTATGAWNGVTGFFSPPSTEGVPTIALEPALPDGVLKMYLGYEPIKTGLDNGYYNTLEIGKSDPHFGLTLGKFYVSGFSQAGKHILFV